MKKIFWISIAILMTTATATAENFCIDLNGNCQETAEVGIEKVDRLTELMLESTEWIIDNTDYEYNGEPLPRTLFYSQEVMQIEYYGEEVARSKDVNLNRIYALYDEESNTIIFDKDIDPEEYRSVVLHEMVHYIQKINGVYEEYEKYSPRRKAACLESEAYLLMEKWMDERDIPLSKLEINKLYIYMLVSSCDRAFDDGMQ